MPGQARTMRGMVPPAPRAPVRPGTPGNVRIIGGRWRGSRLPVASSAGLRPTSDRVRETLFNWLQPMLPGARVLDLFAGTGALGLEALSRGAGQAVLVEREARLAESLRQSCERLQAGDAARVLRADALEMLRTPLHGRFDLVFLDPPFDADAWAPALDRLGPWLSADAWLYVESRAASPFAPDGDWRPHREMATRDAHHGLYRRSGDTR